MISFATIFFTIFLLLILTIVFKAIRQYKFKSFYVKQAQSVGYTVHEHPFRFLGAQAFVELKKQYKLHGDTQYHYKHQLSKPDLIVSNLLFKTMVEIQNPEINKQFYMKANEGYYVKADYGLAHLKRLIKVENLLLSEGNFWKNRRKLLSTVFNYDFITNQIPQIQKITQRALQNLEKVHTNPQNQAEVSCNIVQPLLEVFSTVILKCFFKGDALLYVGKERTIDFISKVIVQITNIGRSRIGALLGVKLAQLGLTQKNRKINQGVREFRKIAKQIVEKRIREIKQAQKSEVKSESNNKSEDIIEALVKNKEITLQGQKGKGQYQTINIDSIINEFVTFFIAGSETTLAFTRMMIYRLAWHPDVLQKVRQELEREANTPQITLDQLKNLKYLQKVQNEVLRMDSSVGGIFMRIATKDHYLGKLKIYKDSIVSIRTRSLHHKETEYPSPNEFNPERWNEKNSANNYQFLPFSAGARNCIGKHLALLENKIFMIEFLRRYKNISISKGQKEIKFEMAGLYGPQTATTTLIKSK